MTNSDFYPAKISHSSLTASARQSLSGNWGIAALGTLIYGFISVAAGIVPVVGPFLLAGPLAVGMATFVIRISRERDADIENIFNGFKQFAQAFIAYFLGAIAILAGFILLVIPGIILMIGLSQTYYVMADKPNISGVDALRESWDLMDGHKLDYFIFSLRFIGWFFLSVFTLFIGLLWLIPYMYVSFAKFYDMIKSGKHPDDSDNDLSKHLLEEDLI